MPITLDLDGSAPGSGYAGTYNENNAGVAIVDGDVAITASGGTITSATITLTRQANDLLSVLTAVGGIVVSSPYDPATGVFLAGAQRSDGGDLAARRCASSAQAAQCSRVTT